MTAKYKDQKCDDLLWKSLMEREKIIRIHWYIHHHDEDINRINELSVASDIRQVKPKPFTSERILPPLEQVNHELREIYRNKDNACSDFWTLPDYNTSDGHPSESSKQPTSGMYPVRPKLEQTMYNKSCSSNTSRKAYLKVRKSEDPQNKYMYPLTNSLEVGWVQPPEDNVCRPKFAKRNIFLDSIGSHHLEAIC